MTNIQPELTPALEAYLVGLIYRNTRTSCTSLAALCEHTSHDALRHLLHSNFTWSRRLWEEFSSAMVTAGGYLVLDDTRWRRWAGKAEAVSWVWSSSAAHIVRGMQVVLLVWTGGRVKVPVGMRLWQKGGKSKVALAERRATAFQAPPPLRELRFNELPLLIRHCSPSHRLGKLPNQNYLSTGFV
jgi:hypothetical protein